MIRIDLAGDWSELAVCVLLFTALLEPQLEPGKRDEKRWDSCCRLRILTEPLRLIRQRPCVVRRPPDHKHRYTKMSGHSDEVVGNDKQVYQGGNQAASAGERRRAALEEIDEAKFSWFHVKACIVAGVGFFTDAYDIL